MDGVCEDACSYIFGDAYYQLCVHASFLSDLLLMSLETPNLQNRKIEKNSIFYQGHDFFCLIIFFSPKE